MAKILVFGKGFIGKRFNEYFNDSEISDIYVTNYQSVFNELEKKKPTVVINCTGKTGYPNTDWCEENKLITFDSNVICPLILLKATLNLGIYFIHLGSGCIYLGNKDKKGYSEEDAPNFVKSYYAKTKVIAENSLKEFNVLQLRLRTPVDKYPSARNLITKLASYNKITNEENSVSVLDDALYAAKILIERKRTGIYNLVNPGTIRNSEIISMYKNYVDNSKSYEIITRNELSKLVKAPRSDCILNTEKLKSEGIVLPDIKLAILNIMKEYGVAENK